jgi:hypothetical protein
MMRAVAIMRTRLERVDGRQVLEGRARDAHEGVDGHALRVRVEARQLHQHAAAIAMLSPMPMMPPEHTVMPARRTARGSSAARRRCASR